MAQQYLEWRNRWELRLDQETDQGNGVYDPVLFPDMDTEIIIPFRLSLRQFTQVYSALLKGALLSYPDISETVNWYFLRNYEFPMDMCQIIADCISDPDSPAHQAVIDLVTHDPDVKQYITNITNQTNYPPGQQLPPGVTGGNILNPNPDCNPDLLWSQCVGLVQTANRMMTDFLEQWETYNNGGEVLSDIIGAIPGVNIVAGIIGISGIIEYANDLVDSIIENYNSDYTLEYEQQLACEIFCMAKDSCEVSIGMLAEVMNTRISGALDLSNLGELLVSLIDQDISGFNVADLYLAAFFNGMAVANVVLPATWGIEAFTRTIAIFNEPNDDWEVLCTDCPEPTENCLDFIGETKDAREAFPGSAQWFNGKGWGNELSAGVGLRYDETSAPEQINKFTIRFYRSWNAATSNPYYDMTSGTVESGGGTAPAQSWGIGADPPRTGQEVTITAPEGTYWLKDDIIINVWASSFTWPGIGGNDAPPQYIAEICFNET